MVHRSTHPFRFNKLRKKQTRLTAAAWGLTVALIFPSLSFAQQSRILTPVGEHSKSPGKPAEQPSARAERPQLVLQTGGTEAVAKVQFSQDGALLAVMGASGSTVKIWDTGTGRELLALKLKDGGISNFQIGADFVFSPDGKSIITYAGGTVRQFETLTGKLIREGSLFEGREYGWAQLSPDGGRLATLSLETNQLRVWDVAAGALLQTQNYQRDNNSDDRKLVHLNAVAFSPDGRSIALSEDIEETMSYGAEITIYDLAGWKPLRKIVVKAAVAQKEQQKMTAKSAREAMKAIMDGKSGFPIATVDRPPTFSRALKFSPDGRSLALLIRDMKQKPNYQGGDPSSFDQAVSLELYDVTTGRPSGSF